MSKRLQKPVLISKKEISRKEFKKLEKDKELDIVGYSCMQKYKENRHRKFRKMLYKDKEYVVRKELVGVTRKYIEVGKEEYVAIKIPAIILILLLMLITFGALFLKSYFYPDKPDNIINIGGVDIEIDTENQPMVDGQPGIDWVGFNKGYVLTKDNPKLNLINPANNTVLFKYYIYEDGKMFYETDWIPPNKMVEADLWSILESGKHEVKIHIDTMDVITKEGCSGINAKTTINIKK